MEIPMLEDDEYQRVTSLKGTGTSGTILEKMYGPMLAEYERITRFHETNPALSFTIGSQITALHALAVASRCERPRRRCVPPVDNLQKGP
jgi:hypothetical protein